jgi:hypothetical protein
MNDPRPLKYMFHNPSEDKRRLSRIIGDMIPYRIGIEFELFGTLANLLPKNTTSSSDKAKALKEKFNLFDYSEDTYSWSDSKEDGGSLNEIRVSIKGSKQLNSLWNVLAAMNENCKIPAENGGIHIHIDFNDSIKKYGDDKARELANNYFNQKEVLDEVLNIFGGYKGSYNKRGSKIQSKGGWINISSKNSVEFRIGRLTYDYKTIIRWIVSLSKLVAKVNYLLAHDIKVPKLEKKYKEEATYHLSIDPDGLISVNDDNNVALYTTAINNHLTTLAAASTAATTAGNGNWQVYDRILDAIDSLNNSEYNSTQRWRMLNEIATQANIRAAEAANYTSNRGDYGSAF